VKFELDGWMDEKDVRLVVHCLAYRTDGRRMDAIKRHIA